MEFGTFYQLPCAPTQSPQTRYEETLIQIQHADALGIDVAWLAELHFFPAFSIMSSPMLVASAMAQRTSRIRLGIAVNLLPLHNPLRNAEDAATLDLLSHGRLEYGAGRGSIPLHFAGYNVSLDESRQRFLEILDILLLAWTTDTFSYDGNYYHYNNIQVVPKPVQKPHPPLRIACNSSESFQLAGERGWRLFCSPVVVPMPRLEADLATYRTLRQTQGTAQRGDEVALMTSVYVNTSATKAREVPEESLTNYLQVLGQMHQASLASDQVQATPRAREMQARLQNMTYKEATDTFAIYGEPAYCIERIQAFKDMFGINQFIPWFNTGGKIPHPQVMESMTLFADRVMPYIA
jgi:alkanesulfonate monooxygenase SsuD/methylene tetrahydromethanopterin reductase-like flavin-dependent oxidoreductase (luciferase family)